MSKSIWTTFGMLLLGLGMFAQKAYKVSYQKLENGRLADGPTTNIYIMNGVVHLQEPDINPRTFIDYNRQMNVSIIKMDDKLYKTTTPFNTLPQPEKVEDAEAIMNFKTKKATFDYFSNTVEIWYTEEAKTRGSLYSRFLPNANALVLQVMINGGRGEQVVGIDKVKNVDWPYPFAEAQTTTDDQFEAYRIASRYQTINIFNDEKINFEGDLSPPQRSALELERTYRFSKGTVIMKKIALPEGIGNDYIFAKLNCRSEGDAYDRTGSVFAIPANGGELTMLDGLLDGVDALPSFQDNNGEDYQGLVRTENYIPPIELMRFFTSFGANHFNTKRVIAGYDWQDDVLYKQDVTGVFPSQAKEVWIGIFIGNYSAEGHRVSLELNIYPGFEESTENPKVTLPLFQTVNLMEMSGQNYPRFFDNDSLQVTVDIPEGFTNGYIHFTSTGHGGWGGGDEFNPKLNELFLDDELLYSIVPWRTDCATNRLYNPASGNFSNGLSSSDLSRSNWCPAMLTPPYVIPIKDLKPGQHILKLAIDQGPAQGNSFSHWGCSAVLVGEIKME